MARDYGRLHTAFWNSPAIRACSDRGKLLAGYLLTGPHSNSIGAYLLPDAYIADDMGWDGMAVTAALKELAASGFCARFADGRHIAICKFLVWNPIENPNVGKAALRQLEQLPNDPAIQHVLDGLMACSKQFPNGLETVLKPFRTTKPSTKPETNHETKPEMDLDAAVAPPTPPNPPIIPGKPEEPEIPGFLKREPNATRWDAGRAVPTEWVTEGDLKRKANDLLDVNLGLEAEKFANFWSSKSGKDATKRDWKATWINWALSASPARGGPPQREKAEVLRVVL